MLTPMVRAEEIDNFKVDPIFSVSQRGVKTAAEFTGYNKRGRPSSTLSKNQYGLCLLRMISFSETFFDAWKFKSTQPVPYSFLAPKDHASFDSGSQGQGLYCPLQFSIRCKGYLPYVTGFHAVVCKFFKYKFTSEFWDCNHLHIFGKHFLDKNMLRK